MSTAVNTTPRTAQEVATQLAVGSSIDLLSLSATIHCLADEQQVSWMLAGAHGASEGLSEYLVSLGVNVIVSDHLSAGERLSTEAILRSPAVRAGTAAQQVIAGAGTATEPHLISRALRSLGAHWHAQIMNGIAEQAGPDGAVTAVTRYLSALADQIDAAALRKHFEQMVEARRRARLSS